MSHTPLAQALQRARQVLERRPDMGLHDDAPATATWNGGTRVTAGHANGTRVASDMPTELGGDGLHVSPGWLFRAGMASCAATAMAMTAAAEGITLSLLEVRVTSRSDTRALLGVPEPDGSAVYPAPVDMQLHVRIAAAEVGEQRLRALVELSMQRSPITNALPRVTPLALHVEVTPSAAVPA